MKKSGNIWYSNKNVCRYCSIGISAITGKRIEFTKDTLEKPCQDWLGEKEKKGDTQKKR